MAVYDVIGNLLDTHCAYICHQVNCQGIMGSGVAKQIKYRFPKAYKEYMEYIEWHQTYWDGPRSPLGSINTVRLIDEIDCREKYIINMFGQDTYGADGKRYTSYDAFYSCLEEIIKRIPKGATIAFPYKIGSDRGGANWNIIRTMIEETLGEDYEVFIYKLEENK